jgi:hypothetical protein
MMILVTMLRRKQAVGQAGSAGPRMFFTGLIRGNGELRRREVAGHRALPIATLSRRCG